MAQWVFEEFRISISKQTLSRELRALGLRKPSARPRHHAQEPRPWRRSKTRRRGPRRDRRARRGGQADRDLVPGRGPDRSEEQDHPAVGATRNADPRHRTTNAPARPISSAPSARHEEPAPASSCRAATPQRWRCIGVQLKLSINPDTNHCRIVKKSSGSRSYILGHYQRLIYWKLLKYFNARKLSLYVLDFFSKSKWQRSMRIQNLVDLV